MNGKQKQKKALTGNNATTKYTRARNVKVAEESKAFNLVLYEILEGTQRRSNQTTRLNHTEECGFGVVACKKLTPGMTALGFPGEVMKIQKARDSFPYLEDYWVGIKGEKDFVLVPSIDRIEAITKTGITSLGCIANEPGPDQMPNTYMTMRKRKKPIVSGGKLTLYLIVGRGCTVETGEQVTWYYGPGYDRNYEINKTGCHDFLKTNCLVI